MLTHPLQLTKHFLPGMIHLNHGHIVNVASVAGYFGSNKMADYCASKYAVVGFTESLKEELRARNYGGFLVFNSFFIFRN